MSVHETVPSCTSHTGWDRTQVFCPRDCHVNHGQCGQSMVDVGLVMANMDYISASLHGSQ